MKLVGGVLYRDRQRPVDTGLPGAMAARVPGVGPVVVAGKGSVMLFATGGGERLWSGESSFLVADLDLTNLDELQALTGTTGGPAVLARLYELEGTGGVGRLRGAFAFALWDRRRRALIVAVDQLGIGRLHYVLAPEGLAFASRPAALLAVPHVQTRVDPTGAYHYLNLGFVPAPHSALTGIRRLPPGHTLTVKEGQTPTAAPYWDVSYDERPIATRHGAAATYRQVEEAVAACLGRGPAKEVGAFLSGGTDSSTVLGLMGRLSGERANAFSIGFREPRYDELRYAELAARHFGAAHYTAVITPDEALGVLPRLVDAYDEPFGNNSAIGTFFCARLARECGVTRLLGGDGGDELFGGNERYRTDRIYARYEWIPAPARRLLEPVLQSLPGGGRTLLGKAQRYVDRANTANPRRFYAYECFFDQEGRGLLNPEFLGAVDPGAPWDLIEEHFHRPGGASELNRLLYVDLKLTIGDNDLLKVTRTAELAGVGVRFPLLDRLLVEFTATLPAHLKLRGLEKRYLFKRAFQQLLPREILAKRKHGFGVPTADWLRAHRGFRELARDVLLSSRARERGFFRPGAIEQLLDRHEADPTPFYGDILWTVLMLELWQRRHLDGARAA